MFRQSFGPARTRRSSRDSRPRPASLSYVPWWTLTVGFLALLAIAVPLGAMFTTVAWPQFLEILSRPSSVDAIVVSVKTAVAAVAIDLVLGIPLAIVLSKHGRFVRVARIIVALPLALPPVVAGLALVNVFGRRGFLGAPLEHLGIHIAFTSVAVVLAQVFVSLPFFVIAVESALRSRPAGLEETAATLGASPTRTLLTVSLPSIRFGIARGTLLALARCLGEFGATLTFAGSFQGTTRTLSLQIYLSRESDPDEAIALGVCLILVAALIAVLTELKFRSPRNRGMVSPAGSALADVSPTDTFDAEETDSESEAGHGFLPASRGHSVALGTRTKCPSITINGSVVGRSWHVHLQVQSGETVALMGPNGSGKSTLCQVICGVLSLDSGELTLRGEDVDTPRRFVPPHMRKIAVMAQKPLLFSHISVLDNVAFPLIAAGYRRKDARLRAGQLLEEVNCSALASSRPYALSGGETARVAFARTIAASPDIIVLDEPTAHLDTASRALLRTLLNRYVRDREVTTILVTHSAQEAEQLAHRVVTMTQGTIVASSDVTHR
ncbi:ATP-binding cassette domain-containing protein [Schaalia sp. ZJ1691]|uniref:ATP-binding cassette domain-containing protein n=1 Tax=Schaalia sp. ZJ1691 TaxID=2709404 RepID=UPI0013EBD0D1|nr:ATP-binding cassette domain-containing protein [Schaalia sp. ZJ1691]